MKKIEKILLALSLLALVTNAYLLPFSSEFLIISLSTLALFYFYCSTALFADLDIELKDLKNKEIYASLSPKRKLGSFGAGASISISIIGLLFYLQFWPGTSLNILTGLVGLLLVLIIGSLRFLKSRDEFYMRVFYRVGVFFVFGLVLMLIPRTTWLDIKYKNHPAYVDALMKSSNKPNNIELQEKVKEEAEKIYNTK